MIRKSSLLLIVVLVIVLSSCSKFNKILRNPSIDAKYDAAIAYYENKDYYRAGILFEELLPNIAGSAKAEKVQYYYGYCHYYQRQFELAAHYFKTFYGTYRRSDFAEDALYMYAQSLFRSVPSFSLDQSNTGQSIEAMQEFINTYPASEKSKEAAEKISFLRKQLETKAYTIAKQYLHLRRYKAAVIALDNFLREFPDSKSREEIAFMKLKSQYDLARLSVQDKQKARYESVIEFYYYLVDKYPNTEYLRQAESMFDGAQRKLASLSNATASTNSVK